MGKLRRNRDVQLRTERRLQQDEGVHVPLLIRALISTTLIASLALADDASDKALALNKEGTKLAEQGKHADAIERFKSAEVLLPRYQHHCNIGIAYQDSGKLPQALLFLQSCVARAGKNASPASKTRLATLEAKLKGAPWGTLVVTGEQLRVAIAPWADEEWVVDGQRSFVLERGAVSLLVKRRDGTTWTQPASVESGASVTVALTPPPPPPPVVTKQPDPVKPPEQQPEPVKQTPPLSEPVKLVTPVEPAARPVTPWIVAGSGAGLLVLGTITYFVAASQVTSFPSTTPESALTGYRALVVTTYASWGLGAVALAGGLVWGLVAGTAAPVTLVPGVGAHGEVSLFFSTRL